MTRRTERERAEEWARSMVWLREDGAMVIWAGPRSLMALGGECGVRFGVGAIESARAVIVETWLRARRRPMRKCRVCLAKKKVDGADVRGERGA